MRVYYICSLSSLLTSGLAISLLPTNKGRMSQRRLLLLLLLLLSLSIESVMSRALSSNEWQRLAGTSANVLSSDTILPCVESSSCRGRAFGSMSEDVSKFGNVPPCRFHGWIRCIEYSGPSIIDAAHGQQYVPSSTAYYHHQQNKDSLSQQQQQQRPPSDSRQSYQEYASYPSKAAGQERPNEPSRFVSTNTHSSFGHQQQQKQQQQQQQQQIKEREMRQQHSAALSHQSVVEIAKHAEWQGNTGAAAAAVHFQQHPDAATPVNKQPVEHWGNQPTGAQRSRPESQGLAQPIQRPVEFQPPHQRFEQSSQQLINPSKFTQQKQQQQRLSENEFLGNNFVEPPRLSQQWPNNNQHQPAHQSIQLTQSGQHNLKTSSLAHQFPAGTQPLHQPIVKVSETAMPVESQRPTSASTEPRTFFQSMPQKVEPIQTTSNPSFRLVEGGGQQIIDPRRFIEPPSQREIIEPRQQQQQRFVQVNQPTFTGPIKNEHPQQIVGETNNNREPQRLLQANQQIVELQRPPVPISGQQSIITDNSFQNKQQQPTTAEPQQQPRQMEPQRLQPLTNQRSAEPRKLEPPPLVKSNSLGESPHQFIEPAKSPLENLFQFDSSIMDKQLAREQLADLIRFLAQSASQQTDVNKQTFGVTSATAAATTSNQFPLQPASSGKVESNILPFIAFSEPLPLEPTSSNSLF